MGTPISPESFVKIGTANVRVWDAVLKPLGYAKYTGLSSVKTLSDTPATGAVVPDGARAMLIVCHDQDIWWRDDGTVPAADDGMILKADTYYWYTGNLSQWRMIEDAISATAHISYYGEEAAS